MRVCKSPVYVDARHGRHQLLVYMLSCFEKEVWERGNMVEGCSSEPLVCCDAWQTATTEFNNFHVPTDKDLMFSRGRV